MRGWLSVCLGSTSPRAPEHVWVCPHGGCLLAEGPGGNPGPLCSPKPSPRFPGQPWPRGGGLFVPIPALVPWHLCHVGAQATSTCIRPQLLWGICALVQWSEASTQWVLGGRLPSWPPFLGRAAGSGPGPLSQDWSPRESLEEDVTHPMSREGAQACWPQRVGHDTILVWGNHVRYLLKCRSGFFFSF